MTDLQSNNAFIQDVLKPTRVALVGFADLSELDSETRRGFQYGISFAIALTPSIVAQVVNGASIDYYNEYESVNAELREARDLLVERIKERGFRAETVGYSEIGLHRSILPFKTLATRSGLGWIGKSGTVVTKEYGNAIRLNGVLTDMPFDVGTPINTSFCDDCMECTANCPGGAIKGLNWTLTTDRDELLDAEKCKSKVVKRGKELGITVGSCGVCVAVCPWTKRYMERSERV
jgi:epoxyqueuosine reductase QueG